ncbi:EAL domain-containing protein [Fictibacillus sp. B-59209]|uniref:bifunctional diguanylate cyclase/phosphodiesterase n=1 Tax=Fictibacillus sp. B-59209 TaxID=3024873 RepID=UPI002E1C3B32|nr:EAL domain-containing protein [Fictibacillus sp. B-59209]
MSEVQTRYSRLATITKMINTKLELKNVLEHVVLAISEEIVNCDSIGIYLPQKDGTYRGYVGKPKVINGVTLDMLVIDPFVDRLAKEVLDTKTAIYIPDTAKDDRPDPRPIEKFSIKSLLCLPIFNGEETYGLVFLFNYDSHMILSESEIQSVEAYVNMAAVAIRNSNQLSRKERLLKDKQLMLDVNRELSHCQTMQQVLDICFSYVGKVLDNPNIGAHLLDPIAEKKIRPAHLSKESDWTEEEWKETHGKIKIDHSKDLLFQEVIRSKKAIYIGDVFSDPRPDHNACRNFGIKGLYMMPLVAMGEVLGTIPVVNLDEVNKPYSETDLQLAQSVVDASASVLSHLLYMEKQELIIQERTSELLEKNKELTDVVGKLQRLSRENELILDSAGDGIFGLDLAGRLTFSNPAAANMLGYENKGELIGQPFSCIYYGDRHKEVSLPISKYNCDEFFYRKDGSKFPVEFVTSSIKEDEETVGYVVTFKDTTFRKQMEEKIRYHAYFDSLTNLPNRVLFLDRLNQGLTYAEMCQGKLAIMFLDLNRFKTINDTLGHSFGDILLKKVADRLANLIPKECTVSRQGGDEFMVIMPRVKDQEEAVHFAEYILSSFSESFDLDGHEVIVKPSIGISLYPDHGTNTDVLIKNADTAMYKAKEVIGGSYECYEKGMDFRTIESVQLEIDLHKALERDEFVLYYQPQVDYRAKEIIGAEALIRWNHPVKGMIPPRDFIPIAEETGLIVQIGEWVLHKGCQQLKKWHAEGHRIALSVNIAALQFKKELAAVVQCLLRETGLEPEYLQLEITENAIIQNTDATLRIMSKLKKEGLKIAIDDFGTGYSSLGYLKNFPIDTLKIDQTFVKDIIQDSNNEAITNTIIALAKNLRLSVIAEGVETKEQIDFLMENDCFLMQGFYFSRPVPAHEFEALYFKTMEENE